MPLTGGKLLMAETELKDDERQWGWIPVVIGLIFLAVSISIFTAEIIGDRNRTSSTSGTVIGERIKNMGEGNVMLPVVRFAAEGGHRVEIAPNTDGPGIGKSVTVRYDPADPTNARIDSPNRWFGPAILLIVGGFLTFKGKKLFSKNKAVPNPDGS